MRWVCFPDGTKYTFAVDIQKFAEKYGYDVPCEADGTRHPGTDCNAKMRTIFKDAGMRKTFEVTEHSVIDIKTGIHQNNLAFVQWLVYNGVVHSSYLKRGVVQLYSKEAVNSLLSVMLNSFVEYEPDDTDTEWKFPGVVVKECHSLEKKKNKPKTSLFKK